MRHRYGILVLLAAMFGSAGQWPCSAKFALLWKPVPIDRLLHNVTRYTHDHARDPAGHYTLGRLYSLRFARGASAVDAIVKDWKSPKPLPLPVFPPTQTILEGRDSRSGPLAGALPSLKQSIREYNRAVELDHKNAIYWLGLGWMLEQGARFATQVDAPFLDRPARVPARGWLENALSAYRRAYSLDRGKDLAVRSRNPEILDTFIGLEGGKGILRILSRRQMTGSEKVEAAGIRSSIRKVEALPTWITPMIFTLNAASAPETLLDRALTVPFDLRGDGRKRQWTWVSPRTGILVWDPLKTGKIVSGRQLFGSVTWSMFWQDGYAPLAALDDNRNGWLEDKESEGIAAWFDRNGNGVCDSGEVVSLADLGITRIAVHPSGRVEGMLANPHGLQRKDGSFLPTYDWVPTGR